MRVVLDTDVLVSALRSSTGASRLWVDAILRKRLEIAISVPLAIEYESVLTRPEQLYFLKRSPEDICLVLDTLFDLCYPVECTFLWRCFLPDPQDDMVLETAVNGSATQIITFNEKDFRGADRFGIEILRPGPAWKKWKGEIL